MFRAGRRDENFALRLISSNKPEWNGNCSVTAEVEVCLINRHKRLRVRQRVSADHDQLCSDCRAR